VLRRKLGQAAQQRARALFSEDVIVPRYEALYRRVCAAPEEAASGQHD
jgi:L-malate glycosyltransferase